MGRKRGAFSRGNGVRFTLDVTSRDATEKEKEEEKEKEKEKEKKFFRPFLRA